MTEETRADASFADEIVDELMPEELDWQRLVRTYPLASASLAAAAGAWLGYKKGFSVASAVTAFAGSRLADLMTDSLRND